MLEKVATERQVKTALLPLWMLLLLIAGGVVLSWANIKVPFFYDDIDQIITNYKIHDITNIENIIFCDIRQNRILQNMSFALNWAISGVHPWSYHFFNNFLHTVNTALLFVLLGLLKVRGKWFKAMVTVLFFIHPLQLQAVTYIMGRVELLKTFFTLSILCLYLSPSSGRLSLRKKNIFIYLLLVLSITAKESCIFIPVFLVAADLFIKGLRVKEISYRNHLLYFSHALWIGPYSYWMGLQQNHNGVVGISLFNFWEYLVVQFHYLIFYLYLFMNPSEQSIYHEYPGLNLQVILYALLGLLLYIFSLYYLYMIYKRKSSQAFTAFFLAFFLISFLPNNSIIQFINPFAEYRLYQSNIGLSYLLFSLIYGVRSYLKAGMVEIITIVFAIYFFAFHGLLINTWKNPLRTWSYALMNYPSSFTINQTLGVHLGWLELLEKSFPYLVEAERLATTVREKTYIQNSFSVYYLKKGELEKSKKYFEILNAEPTFDRNFSFYNNFILLLNDMKLHERRREVEQEFLQRYSRKDLAFIHKKIKQRDEYLSRKEAVGTRRGLLQ